MGNNVEGETSEEERERSELRAESARDLGTALTSCFILSFFLTIHVYDPTSARNQNYPIPLTLSLSVDSYMFMHTNT